MIPFEYQAAWSMLAAIVCLSGGLMCLFMVPYIGPRKGIIFGLMLLFVSVTSFVYFAQCMDAIQAAQPVQTEGPQQ